MTALEPLFHSPWPWVIAGAVLIGLEIVAPGVFLLWIGLGAAAVGLSVLLAPDMPLPWQLMVFAVAMLGSIAIGFMIQRRSRISISGTTLNRELDALVGREVEAIHDFAGGHGRIRVGDSSYTAQCVSTTRPVAAGAIVRITGLTADGILTVVPLDDSPRSGPTGTSENQ